MICRSVLTSSFLFFFLFFRAGGPLIEEEKKDILQLKIEQEEKETKGTDGGNKQENQTRKKGRKVM